MNDVEAAAALYPDESAQAPPATVATPTPAANDKTPESVLYPDVERKPPIKPVTHAADDAEKLYGVDGGGFASLDLEGLHDHLDIAPEKRETSQDEIRQVLGDMQLTGDEGRSVIGALQAAIVEPIPMEKQAQQAEQLFHELEQEYRGADALEAALDHAHEWLKRYPGVPELLAQVGLNNDPNVVRMILAASRRSKH